MLPETETRDRYTQPNEYDLARMDADNRDAQIEDAPSEQDIIDHDDHADWNKS